MGLAEQDCRTRLDDLTHAPLDDGMRVGARQPAVASPRGEINPVMVAKG